MPTSLGILRVCVKKCWYVLDLEFLGGLDIRKASCRIGFAHPLACRWQAFKDNLRMASENKFSFPIRRLSLSLLSDSNQRPRDYKSRALAN